MRPGGSERKSVHEQTNSGGPAVRSAGSRRADELWRPKVAGVGSDLTASTGETGPVPTGENSAVSSDGDILVPDDTPTSPITQKPEDGKTKATQKVTTTTAKPMTYTKTKQDTMFESARGSSILLFYGGSLSDNEKKVAAEFTKQYGITIKYETMGWAEYNAKIAQRVAAAIRPIRRS